MMRMQSDRNAPARLLCSLALLFFVFTGASSANAQAPAAQSPPPPQVQQLLNLLQDPAVRGWIDQQQQPAPGPPPTASEMTASEMMAARTASLREHLAGLAAAAPRLPSEFRSAADRLLAELHGRRPVAVLILVLGFVALGAGTEWLFRRGTARPQQRIVAQPMETVSERVRAIGLRLAFGVSEVAIFGLGSIGAFLAFDWPPLLHQVVLVYLIAAVVLRLALVLGRFAFGRATLDVLSSLGFSPEARELVAYALGLGLLAIALNVVWTRPRASDSLADVTQPPARHAVTPWLLSLCLVLLWGFWVVGFMRLFWLLAVALLLPPAIQVAQMASHHVSRSASGSEAPSTPGLMAVFLDRGIRALLIVGATLLLAHAWQIDLVEMTGRDTLLTRLLR